MLARDRVIATGGLDALRQVAETEVPRRRFALVRRAEGQTWLARDGTGLLPLYHAPGTGMAGPRAAELATDRRIDPWALAIYMATSHMPAPFTMWASVRKCPAGAALLVSEGRAREVRLPAAFPRDRAAAAAALLALGVRGPFLEEIAAGRAPRDEARVESWAAGELPGALREAIGVDRQILLSGGMDSGILAHLARGSGGALRTITFTAAPHDPWSDGAARAAPVARELGSLHEVVSIGPRDFLDALPDYLGSMSEPSLSAYLYYLVARKLPGTGRWLSGLGADEIFLGDPWYGKLLAAERAARFIGRVPVAARRLLAACAAPLAGTHRKKLALLAEERPGFSFLYAYARDNLDLGERLALLAPGIRPPGITRDHVNFSYGPPRGSGLAAMQETLLCRELPDGHGRDVSLFAENLDLSFPFLSPRVVATALVVRPEARAGVGKPFLRRACAAIAPAPVLSLPKGSFLVPPVAWLRGGLASYVRDRLSASRLAARGIWNVAEVTRRVEAFTAGRGSPFDVIRVLLLEAWMDRHGLEAA